MIIIIKIIFLNFFCMAAAGGFYNENSFLFQQKLDLTQLILIFLFLI
jgi:hypothetical protein